MGKSENSPPQSVVCQGDKKINKLLASRVLSLLISEEERRFRKLLWGKSGDISFSPQPHRESVTLRQHLN